MVRRSSGRRPRHASEEACLARQSGDVRPVGGARWTTDDEAGTGFHPKASIGVVRLRGTLAGSNAIQWRVLGGNSPLASK